MTTGSTARGGGGDWDIQDPLHRRNVDVFVEVAVMPRRSRKYEQCGRIANSALGIFKDFKCTEDFARTYGTRWA